MYNDREESDCRSKSADDHLDIDVFYKVGSYAALYNAYGERGTHVSNPYPGIYYIEGEVLFPTQIIVVRELDKTSHIWLAALSGKLEKQDISALLERTRTLREKMDKEYAASVLQVSVTANKKIVDELKGVEKDMCQALLEIMEPEINQIKQETRQEARQEDIAITVNTLRDLGHPDSIIREIIIKNFELSPADADEILIS